MRHESKAERVLRVEALHGGEVPGHLGRALSEAEAVVVHGEPRRVSGGGGRVVLSGALEGLEVLDGHLEDLGLLELGGGRLLEGGGDEPLELVEAAVDPVPPPLLDDAPPPLARGAAPAAGGGGHHGAAGDGAHVLGEGVVVAAVAAVVG